MSVALAPTGNLRFGAAGRFELQPKARRLLVEGQPAALGQRALDMLLALAEQPGRMLSKAELLDTVWPGLVVEESNLHVQVSTLRKLLGGDIIDTVPGRGYRFAAVVQVAPAVAAPPPPAPLRLVGRELDLTELEARLQRTRCLSLVGPGGVGKTSLARVLAARHAPQHVWVDLAALTDAGQIAVAALRACGQAVGEGTPLSQLVNALGTAPLLVLDNAEHLTDAVAALVADLLASLPALRVLVTSQVALQGAGEVVHRLDPLPLAAEDGAQALLVRRITETDHRVRLGEDAQPLLDAICRQLDGLPLALEMAAARVPALGLKRVHDELAHRFELLTAGRRLAAGRHRTLHAALDWSYGLLGAEEQRSFRALGVWSAGFTLDLAVAQIAADGEAPWDVIDRLSTLVDRSLVVVSAEDPPRYRLLETMRAYALEQLAALGEEDHARRRQAQVLLQLTHYGEDEATPATPERCAEIENIGAALPWLLQHDFESAVVLCTRSATIDTFTRWLGQSSRWMEAMEPRMRSSEGQALPVDVVSNWWTGFARTLVMRRHPRARELCRHACMLARASGDPLLLHLALIPLLRSGEQVDAELEAAFVEIQALGSAHPQWGARRRLATAGAVAHAAFQRGDFNTLLAARHQEIAVALEVGHLPLADTARTNTLAVLNKLERHEEAAQMADELLPRLEQQGSVNLPWAYGHSLEALIRLRRHDAVHALLPRALDNARDTGIWSALEALMELFLQTQRRYDVARLLGFDQRLQAQGQEGIAGYLEERSFDIDPTQTFDDTTRQRLFAEGAALDVAGLVALARAPERT